MVHSWEHLHHITHIDHHFQTVDHSFVCPSSFADIWQLDTTPYQQSIQMFAIIPITLGLIYFLISLLWIAICCCKSCRNNNNQPLQHASNQSIQEQLLSDNNIYHLNNDHDDKHDCNQQHVASLSINSRSNLHENIPSHRTTEKLKLLTLTSVSQYALAFISLCIIIFSICIGASLNSTIIDVQSNWDESYKPYDICINYGHSMEHILQSVIYQCKSIRNADLPSDCQDAVPIIDQIIPKIQNSLDYLDKYVSDGEVVSWGKSSQIDPYRRYLIYSGVIFLLFIAVLIIISFLKTCTNKWIWCNKTLSYFLTCSILLIWIISSIQLSVSVEVSDACVNPQNTILQGINMTENANINYQTFEIVKYYIYCDQFHAYNPLHNYTMYAYNSLISVNSTIYQIIPYAAVCNITKQTDVLLNDYLSTLRQLIKVEEALKCDDINAYLATITSDLCESGINYWFLLYVLQMVMIVLLITKNCCICCKKNNHCNVAMDDDYNENDTSLTAEERQQMRIKIIEEGVDNELSTSQFAMDKQINDSNYTDNDIKKCLHYLLKFIDSNEQPEKKGNELEQQGYNNTNGKHLNANVVRQLISSYIEQLSFES